MKQLAGFRERLAAGETIVVAEGYLFEFERRGFLKAGAFVPEVVLERPEQVKALHEEFVHAGSDVVLAFTVTSNQILETHRMMTSSISVLRSPGEAATE